MAPRPTTPRIPPLPPEEEDEQARELLATSAGTGGLATNIFRTLVRNPGMFRRWGPFGGKVLNGKLPARERELMILRTGWNCQSEYEWGQHVGIGKAAGLTDDEIERIKAGPDDAGWDPFDATLL